MPMFFIRCGLLAVMFSAYCLSVLFYLKNKIARSRKPQIVHKSCHKNADIDHCNLGLLTFAQQFIYSDIGNKIPHNIA